MGRGTETGPAGLASESGSERLRLLRLPSSRAVNALLLPLFFTRGAHKGLSITVADTPCPQAHAYHVHIFTRPHLAPLTPSPIFSGHF